MDNIRDICSLWDAGYPHSKGEMLEVRQEFQMGAVGCNSFSDWKSQTAGFAKTKCSSLIGKLSVHELRDSFTEAAHGEVVDYVTVMGRASSDGASADFVNPTLFERVDWDYSLHYGSVPFFCFHHSFFFKKSVLKNLGLDQKMLDLLPVADDEFLRRPLWANSFQQFALMMASVQNAVGPNLLVRFQFYHGDCLDFLAMHGAALKKKEANVSFCCLFFIFLKVVWTNLFPYSLTDVSGSEKRTPPSQLPYKCRFF